jgi:hypothetical protein
VPFKAKNTLRNVDANVVEAAFASRMAERGDHEEVPLRSPLDGGQDLTEAAEPPGRAELMAALRASVELAAAKEAPLPATGHNASACRSASGLPARLCPSCRR